MRRAQALVPHHYVDRHYIHEVTSPQAFEGLKTARRSVAEPDKTIAVVDHNVPQHGTGARASKMRRAACKSRPSRRMCAISTCRTTTTWTICGKVSVMSSAGAGLDAARHGCRLRRQPHCDTRSFGTLAHGIGTSEVEHVLATQTLVQKKSKNMCVNVAGELKQGVYANDLALCIIGKIGTAGGIGHIIEYCGTAVRELSMEARITLCNMTIEAGARAGLIAPGDKTIDYVKTKPHAPADRDWPLALAAWKALESDDDAVWDRVVEIAADDVAPTVTWEPLLKMSRRSRAKFHIPMISVTGKPLRYVVRSITWGCRRVHVWRTLRSTRYSSARARMLVLKIRGLRRMY